MNKDNTAFKDKLNQLDLSPNDAVWEQITEVLDKKEKDEKIVIPFWYKGFVIAASFTLLFYLGRFFFHTDEELIKPNQIITLDNNKHNDSIIKFHQKTISPKLQENIVTQKSTIISKGEIVTKKQSLSKQKIQNHKLIIAHSYKHKKNEILFKSKKIDNLQPKKNIEREKVENITTNTFDINIKEKIIKVVDSMESNVEVTVKEDKKEILSITDINNTLIITNKQQKKWQISSVLSIRSDLTSKDIDTGYGASISYALYPNISIRSGISKINADSFKTTSLYETPGTGMLEPTTVEINKTNYYSYTEIPIEIEYKVLNKKFGTSVIGGVSTLLFNVKNESETIKNNNTVNIGLGFSYNHSKGFSLQIEPIYKTFLNNEANANLEFKDSFFGVYGGLSYNF